MITIRGLHKSYWLDGKEIAVLRGIDLDIARGERISIIGRSGSGKSTFLHVLGTLDVPSRGSIRFATDAAKPTGVDVFAQRGAALAAFRNRTMGFVFQFHHLLPEFTALENVMMPTMIQRMPSAEGAQRAREMLGIVGLLHRLDHRPGELSGGEQQRVAIARALVLRPALLLADEPTGNLDEQSARGIHELMDRLNQEIGLTIVLVTHSSRLAEHMPRRLLMHEGRLVSAESTALPAPGEPPEPAPARDRSA